jgi:multiple sugar transport system ATP-binding protein
MADISLNKVSKVYSDGTNAVKELDLEVGDGEFVVLVGPSGCGKTSALRMVAGLEEITAGTISIGGRVVNDLLPKQRDIAMVFQNYALYPHMTVYDNMAFGLRYQRVAKQEIKERVTGAARTLGLQESLQKKPRMLSGGQRQRVAMGRAIVREPQVFLMDEPLSNLDAKLRVDMRAEIQRIQRTLSVTTIYVTHDQTEAMTMGDRVAVMRGGLLQQVDPPQRLYDRPVNLFVAEFIGSPAMNLVEARLEARDGGITARFGSHSLRVGAKLAAERPELATYKDKPVILGFRPEDMEDADLNGGGSAGQTLSVVPTIREEMGPEVYVRFSLGVPMIRRPEVDEAVLPEDESPAADEKTAVGAYVARLGSRTEAAEGRPLTVAVDTDRLYFFDPATGHAV